MRAEHRPQAAPLTPEQRRTFEPFFSPATLDRVRVRRVDRIENPAFFEVFGENPPLDFRRANGVALADTVLLTRPAAGNEALLFHELVHVAQDRLLGDDYMELYVRGWAENGFDYGRIPHEAQAFELAARFGRRPDRPFSVEEEVRDLFE